MKKYVLLAQLLSIFIASIVVSAQAAVIQLPQTGQTICYDANGNVIACAGTGQDGDIQAGVPWPNPRFQVTGDCVTDKLTGLMWARNGNLPNGSTTWYQALDYVASLNSGSGLCGYNDWRLANVIELESLVNEGEAITATWLNAQGFINVQSDDYWSSTTGASYGLSAWTVNMWDGYVSNSYKSYNNNYYYKNVWPVRAGQSGSLDNSIMTLPKTGQTKCYNSVGAEIPCAGTGQDGELQAGVAWPVPRFNDNGDQTVTDNLSGLVWSKDANAPGPAACNPGIYKTWGFALDYVKCLNANSYLGYTDWRLPNRKELLSLLDFSEYNPALPQGYPFTNVQAGTYWSSTTYADYTSYAWQVDIKFGGTSNDGKFGLYGDAYVWPVHGGPLEPQPCTYVYSDWGACQPDNTQTRTVLTSSPDGCVGTPDTSRSCTYVPPCDVPTSYYIDNSGALGLFEGVLTGGGNGVIDFKISPTDTYLFGGSFSLWAVINYLPDAGITVGVNPNDPTGSDFAQRGIIGPNQHASYEAKFCKSGDITYTLSVADLRALSYTMANILVSAYGIIPVDDMNKVIDILSDANKFPYYNSSLIHLQNALVAASNQDRRTALKELRDASADMRNFSLDRTEQLAFNEELVKVGISIGLKKRLLGPWSFLTKALNVITDMTVYTIQSKFNTVSMVIVVKGQ